MIQHIQVDAPPLIKSQVLLNLGRVNILTGRNSSGKSTILKKISEKLACGITYHQTPELADALFATVPKNYSEPSLPQFQEWIAIIQKKLDGFTFFSTSEQQIRTLISQAKAESSMRRYSPTMESQFPNIILSLAAPIDKVLLLSPKRRPPFQTEANTSPQFDYEAQNSLSRLFLLKNQASGTKEKTIYEEVLANFKSITGIEFEVEMPPQLLPLQARLRFRHPGGSWIAAQDDGLGLTELLSILLYSVDGDHNLLLLEEPENHLHPDFQRRLLSFLSSVEDKQFLITTHSPVFLNPTMIDRIYLSKYSEGEITIEDEPGRAKALSQIGVLAIDNFTSDAIILSEGKNDVIIITVHSAGMAQSTSHGSCISYDARWFYDGSL